jgi:hypothetical protein
VVIGRVNNILNAIKFLEMNNMNQGTRYRFFVCSKFYKIFLTRQKLQFHLNRNVHRPLIFLNPYNAFVMFHLQITTLHGHAHRESRTLWTRLADILVLLFVTGPRTQNFQRSFEPKSFIHVH